MECPIQVPPLFRMNGGLFVWESGGKREPLAVLLPHGEVASVSRIDLDMDDNDHWQFVHDGMVWESGPGLPLLNIPLDPPH